MVEHARLPLVANGATQAFPTAWSTILAAYPDATVLAYGANLGKGSAGASARVDDLTFGGADACATHQWSTRFDRKSRHISKRAGGCGAAIRCTSICDMAGCGLAICDAPHPYCDGGWTARVSTAQVSGGGRAPIDNRL
jgi:hypothetical protein